MTGGSVTMLGSPPKLARYLERAIAFLLATVVAACVGSGFSDDPTDWKTYYGTPDDYTFEHPVGW